MKFMLVLILLLTSVAPCLAENGFLRGKVKYLRVHDGKEFPSWAPPVFWFTLTGVTAAGKCPKFNGDILLVMDGQMAFSMILAAQMSGRELAVFFDDTKLNVENVWCRGVYLTSGDPAPLF